jgi:hypothetical protein
MFLHNNFFRNDALFQLLKMKDTQFIKKSNRFEILSQVCLAGGMIGGVCGATIPALRGLMTGGENTRR